MPILLNVISPGFLVPLSPSSKADDFSRFQSKCTVPFIIV